MVDDLKLSMDSKQVELTLDNCTLLPQHTVKDIIREGDTIQQHWLPRKRENKASGTVAFCCKTLTDPCLTIEDSEADKTAKKKKADDKNKQGLRTTRKKVGKKKEKEDVGRAARELERRKEEEREMKKKMDRLKKEEEKKEAKRELEKSKEKAKREQERLKKEQEKLRKEEVEKEKKLIRKEQKKIKREQEKLKKLQQELRKEHQKAIESRDLFKAQMEQSKAKEDNTANDRSKDHPAEAKQLKDRLKKKDQTKNELNVNNKQNKAKKALPSKKQVTEKGSSASELNEDGRVSREEKTTVGGQEQSKTHTIFEAYDDLVETDAIQKDPKNLHGRALVTFSEASPRYNNKKRNNYHTPIHQYPIHSMPTLFYAEKSPREEQAVEQEKKEETQSQVPINYEELPTFDLKESFPSMGDRLALKTLELTAFYTPEISDWKHVVLKELYLAECCMAIEYIDGFSKTSTKGGKFELRRKRNYEEEWEEEEEEEEEKDDLINFGDIHDIRKFFFDHRMN
ncbi:hypothetical protein G6F53_011609 [Rhizopus delemar]|nr:hypothetical protein G6F54_010888 [Rhizopus delemar]KAG1499033.1 hypothetical protein G6F53_011609 [Rhizopus delemar]KAG1513837.1 hypothetical protein G6F52_010066 [Rhizopus delemar]